jgi:thioesterase domain-containing protein
VRHLPHERPIFGFLASESQEGEPESIIEDVAARYLREMRAIQPAGPYFLAGWSLGGLIAFEMARQLQEDGLTVAALVLIDSHPAGAEAASNLDLLANFALGLGISTERLPGWLRTEAANLPLEDLWDRMAREAQVLRLFPEDLDLASLRLRFDSYRAHYRAMLAYRLRPYPSHATLVLAENGDDLAGKESTLCAWRRVVAELETLTVPGGHHSILKEPQVRALAERCHAAMSCRERTRS